MYIDDISLQEIYPDEVGKIGVSVDALLDKKNLLLFHGLDLVAKKQNKCPKVVIFSSRQRPSQRKEGKVTKRSKYIVLLYIFD